MTTTGAGRYTGQSVQRKEDVRLITGHGRYTDDVSVSGLLHAAFLRSDLAKARIASLDCSAAAELDGVVAVFTAQDFEGRFGEAWHAMLGEQLRVPPPLAATDVRHVGEPIALVVAENRYVAEDACELIEIDFEPEDAVVGYEDALDPASAPVHGADGMTSNVMVRVPSFASEPDVERAFEEADHVVTCTVRQNRYLCAPMEARGIVADWRPGRDELDIVCSCQGVHETRNFFARYLDIPEGRIRVSAPDVGGGFGQKMFVFREECAVVLAARLLGRPVKWIEDRRENLIAACHSRNERGHVRVAVNDDLTFQAIAVDHLADVGAFPVVPSVMNGNLLPGPYRTPRLAYDSALVFTNTMGKGAYRGPWMFETTAREMAIDHAARVLGVDPVELRRKNLLSSHDLPFLSPGGQPFREMTPLETLEQALEMLDLEAFRREQAAARAEGRLLGLGISVYVEPTSTATSTLATEGATVRVESSGTVVAFLSTTSHGQSIETTMAQIVADVMGVNYEDVTIVQADSQSTPYGPGTGGSRTAVVAGGAARAAATAVRDKALAIAGELLEVDPGDLEIADGTVSVLGDPSSAVSLKEIARRAYRVADQLPPELDAGLEATIRFRPTQFPTWSNATHLCVVEVDRETFLPRVLRYIVSEDCGAMINPAVVEGQIAGGVVQGLGGALLEDFRYDEAGNPLTTTFLDYLLPTTTDVPMLEIGHIETPSTSNPGGFKGMGEGGAIGSHAAVANAVADALAPFGVHVTETPLTPDRIHALLEGAPVR
jgi:carbon-monoxide dehydrogenase large subunit